MAYPQRLFSCLACAKFFYKCLFQPSSQPCRVDRVILISHRNKLGLVRLSYLPEVIQPESGRTRTQIQLHLQSTCGFIHRHTQPLMSSESFLRVWLQILHPETVGNEALHQSLSVEPGLSHLPCGKLILRPFHYPQQDISVASKPFIYLYKTLVFDDSLVLCYGERIWGFCDNLYLLYDVFQA